MSSVFVFFFNNFRLKKLALFFSIIIQNVVGSFDFYLPTNTKQFVLSHIFVYFVLCLNKKS